MQGLHKRRCPWRLLGLCLLFVFLLLFGLWVYYGSPWYTPAVIVSPETTYVTEPLAADGLPDYVAAVNRHFSQGVTPENNAAVLWWRAVGREAGGETIPAEVFRQLGMAPPARKRGFDFSPRRAVAFADTGQEKKYEEAAWEAWHQLRRRPWRSEQFPVCSRLLEWNQEALDLCVQGSRRRRFFSPAIAAHPQARLYFASAVPLAEVRELARCLQQRAMRHLGHGRVEEAWRDLCAVKRTGRLLQQCWHPVGIFVGRCLEAEATEALATLLARCPPSQQQALAWLKQWDRLPPPASLADRIGLSDRLEVLSMLLAHSQGLPALVEAGYPVNKEPGESLSWDERLQLQIDPNLAMRICNQVFDQASKMVALPDPKQALDQLGVLVEYCWNEKKPGIPFGIFCSVAGSARSIWPGNWPFLVGTRRR